MSKRKRISKENNIWGFDPYSLSLEQQQKYLKRIVQRANKRMQRIRRSGRYSYAVERVEKELASKGRKNFSSNQKTPRDIINEIYLVEAYLAHETSTLTNLKKIQSRAWDKLRDRLLRYTDIDINTLNLTQKDFYKFMNSQSYKDMQKRNYGSDSINETMVQMLDEDPTMSLNDILSAFEEWLPTELPLQAVLEMKRGNIKDYGEFRRKMESRRKPIL